MFLKLSLLIIDYNYMHKIKIRFCNIEFRKKIVWYSPQTSAVLDFSTISFLNLGMLWFLSTYEINLKLGYTYV